MWKSEILVLAAEKKKKKQKKEKKTRKGHKLFRQHILLYHPELKNHSALI